VTKIVFLCFFYSVIFPSSFFFGAAALAISYWTEKFNLLVSDSASICSNTNTQDNHNLQPFRKWVGLFAEKLGTHAGAGGSSCVDQPKHILSIGRLRTGDHV
jgi:hypothetical protein